MAKNVQRVLKDIKITEISGVDRPAQEGARKVLIKRADDCEDEDKKGKGKMPKGKENNENEDDNMPEMEKTVKTLTKSVEALTKENEALKKAQERAEAIQKFDADMLAYFKGLKPEAQEEFLTKSSTLQKAAVANFKASDEEVVIEGQTIRKSVVGDATFAIFKAQDKRIKDNEEAIAKANAKAADAEIRKMVSTEFAHLTGTEQERFEMLKSVMAMPEAAKNQMLKTLKASEATNAALFKRKGSSFEDNDESTAAGKVEKMAKKMQADSAGKLTYHQAYSKVLEENPNLYSEMNAAN